MTKDTVAFKDVYGTVNNLLQWTGKSLNNGGDEIVLIDKNGITVDSVQYDNELPWPLEPDGNGPSLELIEPTLDNAEASNWQASDALNAPWGTPGQINSVHPSVTHPPVIISRPDTIAYVDSLYQYQVMTNLSEDVPLDFQLQSTASFLQIDSAVGLVSGTPAITDTGRYAVKIIVDAGEPGRATQEYHLLVLAEPIIPPCFRIVINEIMYNPVETGSDTTEFIELFNADSETVDLSGWRFTDGVECEFPDSTLLEPGEFLVVAEDTAAFIGFYKRLENLYEWRTGSLKNDGEAIVLSDNNDNLIDSVLYENGGDWPAEANGTGPSLELLDPTLENTLAINWHYSLASYGTPGEVNSVYGVSINHSPVILSTPDTIVYVDSLYQYQVDAQDIDQDTLKYLLETEAAFLAIDSTGLVEGIPTAADTGSYLLKITVEDQRGGAATQAFTLHVLTEPPVVEAGSIVINEIMYNPVESGTDSTEFIELFNNDSVLVNLSGWAFIEGIEYVFPESTLLNPGEFLVVADDSTAMILFYGPLNRLHQWSSGSLNNSGEKILLVDANQSPHDWVDYDDGGDWPTAPDGSGPSLELKNPGLDNNLTSSWLASDSLFGTPGSQNSVYQAVQKPASSNPDQHLKSEVPTEFRLHQNYPNPFNPTTTIRYALARDSQVYLAIYNIRGRCVHTLVEGFQEAGEKTIIWDGTDSAGIRVPSGLYLYHFKAGDFESKRKLLLIK